MSPVSGAGLLKQLSSLYGLQTAYYDVSHRRCPASTESLLTMLRSLGAPVTTVGDVPSALRERKQAIWRRLLEPVTVTWNGAPPVLELRLPANAAGDSLNYTLTLETGEERRGRWLGQEGEVLQSADVEGARYLLKRFHFPESLPSGYHRLVVERTRKNVESLIISSPHTAYNPPVGSRMWGVFLPVYAIRTKEDWGSGDFRGLAELAEWVGGLSGQSVAILPLLASFLDGDDGTSPYLPVSRLLWNEFYLSLDRSPELPECPSAQEVISSTSFRKEVDALRRSPLVDYRRQMTLKRQVLEEMSICLFRGESSRLNELKRFVETHPMVDDYARFRAVCEKRASPWMSWPRRLKEGIIEEDDYDEKIRRYHLYVQWLAHQQMEIVSNAAGSGGVRLYLDLPLGVHPDGYDAWRYSESYIRDARVGSPPDVVFTRGQSWGFPPLHPERPREQGYRYLIACFRHHLRHAGILRIDHVMGFHRLFCIPAGMEPRQGVYLRYPAEEIYAILALESQRHRTIIVGEDLGTVPRYVRPTMKRHGLNRMYVLHYELADSLQKGIHPANLESIASMNTHDMPPFAAFWQGRDIEERLRLGLLDKASASREKKNLPKVQKALLDFLRNNGWLKETEKQLADVLRACLAALSASRAQVVLVNLEDLWLETQPQNVPTTSAEYPNWRHKTKYTFDEFCQMPQVIDILQKVNELRGSERYFGKKEKRTRDRTEPERE